VKNCNTLAVHVVTLYLCVHDLNLWLCVLM